MMNKLKIGLFGFGCVGGGLYEVLNKSKLLNASIEKIVVKDPTKKRAIAAGNFSFDKNDILQDENINVVVELINDPDAAYEIVKTAISKGKHVVTANKKMIALHLAELIELKKQGKVSFLYEASACGSIPVIRNLEEYYNNDSLRLLSAITNGTTNYMLTRMDMEGKSYEEVLTDAQAAGFAETDPTLDVDGFDSKYKLTILLAHTFGLLVNPDQILNMGIRHIKKSDIRFAREKGYKIRLITHAEKEENEVIAYVLPQFTDSTSFAYDVNFEFNAVALEAAFSDRQVFKGKGAGSYPTASAVLSDISALLYDYDYEYKKLHANGLIFNKDFRLKLFVSADAEANLDKIFFDEICEKYTSPSYCYRIGYVSSSQLSHDLYRQNPELFIAIIN
jgi:homoserine dehydrogenase